MCNLDIVDYARLLFNLVLFARNLFHYQSPMTTDYTILSNFWDPFNFPK